MPADATKASHPKKRSQCKAVVLGVNYGMGERTLAHSIGCAAIEARELLRLHRATYRRFWEWNEAAVNHASLYGYLDTVFGWRVQVDDRFNPRSLMNFPMQANGAEILRLACCEATEAGLSLCAPVHDALLLEAPLERLEADAAKLQAIMVAAGETVLSGFTLRTDVEFVRYPERYRPEKGQAMWDRVMGLLERDTLGKTHTPPCARDPGSLRSGTEPGPVSSSP